jgi:glycosyltransferase involved in cell wall biosynthesis
VDIAHVHAPNPTMFAALAVLPKFRTLVVTHHSDVVKQRLLGAAFAPVERLIHWRAAMVLSDSEDYILGSAPLKRIAAKVRTLPLGLDLAPFLSPSRAATDFAAKLRVELGKPLWLTVGRLVYYKGICNAIDALPGLPGRLMIVGDGPLKQTLIDHAKARGVSDRILWAGYLDADELAATALLFPSNARSEGFGLAQVEAMASGCPVINTQIPHSGVTWVSRHDETGLTVPVDDPAALQRASLRMLDEPLLRARFSAASIARARQEFDHHVMAERSFRLYDEAAQGITTQSRGEPTASASPDEYLSKPAVR